MGIQLNYWVEQGYYGIISAEVNIKFGTDGLATCIGIIAHLNDGRIFCGHLDIECNEPSGIDQKNKLKTYVRTLLESTPLVNAAQVSYVTTSSFASTKCVTDVIKEMFPSAVSVSNIRTCFYIDNGVLTVTNNGLDENFGQKVNQHPFTVKGAY